MNRHYALILCVVLLLTSCSSTQTPSTDSSHNTSSTQASNEHINTAAPRQESNAPTVAELRKFPAVMCEASASKPREVRARHIPFEVPPYASESQWRAAYAKALDAKSKLQAGEPFEQVESKYGLGASSRGGKGGDLGFFKAGVMVPEFERMAFCLPRGSFSPIFASDFGFHILEVTNVRP